MKLHLAIPGLLIALLVGCNDTTTVATSNPFDSVSFPKAGCGDQMPTNGTTDTVNLYPVFVDYSDSNLQTIKANYCGDALKITTKNKGKYVIQVASFTSEERAHQFKDFLARKLGSASVEVGEATVIGAKPIPKSTKNVAKAVKPKGNEQSQDQKTDNLVSGYNSPYAIGKAAKLTPAQIKELIEMEKHKSYITYKEPKEEVKSRFVIPTYIPAGFQVSRFLTQDDDGHGGLRYRIDYCNSSKFCFAIIGGIQHGIGDAPISFEIAKKISSPALGEVELGYANYDGTNNKPHVSFTGAMNRFVKDNNFYVFLSAGGYLNPDDQTISLNEATKIVESLQYLNPQHNWSID